MAFKSEPAPARSSSPPLPSSAHRPHLASSTQSPSPHLSREGTLTSPLPQRCGREADSAGERQAEEATDKQEQARDREPRQLPHFIAVGVGRSGTTWLHEMLKGHVG